MQALKEGDFGTAARELSRARDAVDVLRRTDDEANNIRRNCREAVVGHGLSHSNLFDVLSEYATDSKRGHVRFNSVHRNAWLIFDASVIVPEGKTAPCVIDMPLILDEMKFRVEIDSPALRRFAKQSEGATRVIFAAQMANVRVPDEKEGPAVLVLDGKTAFLWTTLETYQALGYAESRPEDLAATQDLLSTQLEQMEEPR